jgi:endonuclease IV
VASLRCLTQIRASVCRQPWSLRTLALILNAVRSHRLKVCVDVCHAYIAEFDLAGAGLGRMRSVLANEVGWHRIAGVHVSDAVTPHGGRCEGHAK